MSTVLIEKDVRAYAVLTSLVICGLTACVITAPKVVQVGPVNFPFSTLIFSLLTYPIVDCICELWGKAAARQTLWLGLSSQLLFVILIQLSILVPKASFWQLQSEYQTILAVGGNVVVASLLAFSLSQILDITIYQRIKGYTQGKWLWLRSNISTYVGQVLDSLIFVSIVFYGSDHKLEILAGSLLVKIILSFLMTPFVYLIVLTVNAYLNGNTLAFKHE